MELKVVCNCGQKYKFDVEPIGGRMPIRVNCPVCGADGTKSADDVLAQHFPNQAPPIPMAVAVQTATAMMPPPPPIAAAASAAGLRVNRPAPAPMAATAGVPPLPAAPRPIAPISPAIKPAAKPSKKPSMGLGVLGALVGAALGAGLMYGFYELVGFRFPLTGVGIGALAGYGARLMGRGTDTTLGIITGAIALVSVFGTFYLMYGGFAIFNIISIVLCVGVAYRVASE